ALVMISRSANSQPRAPARARPISVPPLPIVSDMATMLMVHPLPEDRTPPAAMHWPTRAFVAALRNLVLESHRTPAVWTSRFPGRGKCRRAPSTSSSAPAGFVTGTGVLGCDPMSATYHLLGVPLRTGSLYPGRENDAQAYRDARIVQRLQAAGSPDL